MATATPSPTPHTAAELEALERSRRHMLAAVVITSALWLVPPIVQGFAGEALPRTLRSVLVLVGVLGALAWMLFMWRFHRFQGRVQNDPALRAQLDDERILALRRESICRGWMVLVIALGLGIAAAPFTELPDVALLYALMLVAVNAPILFFLALDRD
jgi:hypothetical protein